VSKFKFVTGIQKESGKMSRGDSVPDTCIEDHVRGVKCGRGLGVSAVMVKLEVS